MADIAKLTVALYANSAAFVSELNRSSREAKKWGGAVAGHFASVAKTATVYAGASAAAAAAITYTLKTSLDAIDQLATQAANLSIPVGRYQELAYAAKISGTDLAALGDVIKDVSVKVQDAAFASSGPMVDFFSQIGQDARDWAALRPDQQFARFVDEINKMDANQARFWLDEVNDSAAQMFHTLYGSGGFSQLVKEAESAGLAMDQHLVDNAKKARQEFDQLFALSGATWDNLIAASAPAIEYVLTGINSWILEAAKAKGGFSALGQSLALSVLEAVRVSTQALVELHNDMIDRARAISEAFGQDWFTPPNAHSLQLTIDNLEQVRQQIYKTRGEWNAPQGDVPGWFALPPDALADIAEIDRRMADLRQQLSGHISADGLFAELDQLALRVQGMDLTGPPVTVPTFAPPPTPNRPTPAAEDPAVLAFQKTNDLIVEQWARRAEIDAAGLEAVRLQEQFAHEDRLVALGEQFQSAYAAAIGNQELMDELEANYFAGREALLAEHQANLTQIEKDGAQSRAAAQAVAFRNASDLFGSMADIAKASAGEQSGIYKAMFVASKAFAVAESIVKIQQGLASAAALPFPSNLGAMTSVATATAGIISTIQGTQLTGMSHDGTSGFTRGRIPREGTWFLDEGQRVQTRPEADRMDRLHDAVVALAGSGGAAPTFAPQMVIQGGSTGDDSRDRHLAQQAAQYTYEMIMRDFRSNGTLRRQLGV